jgi:hypothetical protein
MIAQLSNGQERSRCESWENMTVASFGGEVGEIQVGSVAGFDDGAIGEVNLNSWVGGRGINTGCIGL